MSKCRIESAGIEPAPGSQSLPEANRPVLAGMVGTFDLNNFGDLLFPLLAEHELRKRWSSLQLIRYSYRPKESGQWPYEVRSLSHLPEDIHSLDLLLVGGGHLIRLEKHVAPGYGPLEACLHHPTSYWLMPTLLGLACGVPVAWNGVGVSIPTPFWARGLLALAVRETPYVSVRDEPSGRELREVSGHAPVHIVPDTAFGVASLLPPAPSARFHSFCEKVKLSSPYVIVQPSRHLLSHADHVKAAVREARTQGCAVLELPISPILGDGPQVVPIDPPPLRSEMWPDPLLLAEIIANAEAVIAQSLHLSIVALAAGVPVHRPRSSPNSKYNKLERFLGIHLWEPAADAAAQMKRGLGKRPPGADVAEALLLVQAHWDAIARLASQHTPARPGITASVINICASMADQSVTG